jgi:hypothetical protein
MKVFRVVVAIALLTGPAYAQMPAMNLLTDFDSKTPQQKADEELKQKAYKESLKKIPDASPAKTSGDPWGNVRSTDAGKASASKASASKASPSKTSASKPSNPTTAASVKPRTKTSTDAD